MVKIILLTILLVSVSLPAVAESPGDSVKPIHGAEFLAGTALGIGMFLVCGI